MPRIFNHAAHRDRRKYLHNLKPKAEVVLWYYLKHRKFYGHKFRRQQGIGKYIVDFYCPKLRLAIELDGGSHFEPRQQRYDAERTKDIASRHITVIRFTNDRIL